MARKRRRRLGEILLEWGVVSEASVEKAVEHARAEGLRIGEAMVDGSFPFDGDYPTIVGGRYGLGSAEFNAGMCKAVLDNLKQEKPKNHFTIGIFWNKLER